MHLEQLVSGQLSSKFWGHQIIPQQRLRMTPYGLSSSRVPAEFLSNPANLSSAFCAIHRECEPGSTRVCFYRFKLCVSCKQQLLPHSMFKVRGICPIEWIIDAIVSVDNNVVCTIFPLYKYMSSGYTDVHYIWKVNLFRANFRLWLGSAPPDRTPCALRMSALEQSLWKFTDEPMKSVIKPELGRLKIVQHHLQSLRIC